MLQEFTFKFAFQCLPFFLIDVHYKMFLAIVLSGYMHVYKWRVEHVYSLYFFFLLVEG